MPVRSSRPCNKAGCVNLAQYPHRYCSTHYHLEVEEDQRRQEYLRDRYKQYSKNRDDIKEQRFYVSKQWIDLREYTKAKYKGLCLYSYYMDHEIVPAETVHHIIEVKEDWERRLDPDNLIPLTHAAHNRIHYFYKNNKREETQRLLKTFLKTFKHTFEAGTPGGCQGTPRG